MSQTVFRRSRRVQSRVRAPWPSAASTSRSPSRSKVIGDVLAGRDVLAKSPTGSGKTLAFVVPIVDRIEATDRRPAALVLAPTRELATQIVEASYRDRPRPRPQGPRRLRRRRHREAGPRGRAAPHIIVATPGRLEDLLRAATFSLSHVQILVLDEADRMLDMGFRPPSTASSPSARATARRCSSPPRSTARPARIAQAYTTDAVAPRARRRRSTRRADIEHRFLASSATSASTRWSTQLRSAERELALVFVRTKRGADRLVKRLGDAGRRGRSRCTATSPSASARRRSRSFEAGRVDTLVATDVAARGIDVDGISHVINFDPPEDREGYVHRIGRTGRAGRTGVGITFVGGEHAADMSKIVRELELEREYAASGHELVAAGGGGGGQRRSSRASADAELRPAEWLGGGRQGGRQAARNGGWPLAASRPARPARAAPSAAAARAAAAARPSPRHARRAAAADARADSMRILPA